MGQIDSDIAAKRDASLAELSDWYRGEAHLAASSLWCIAGMIGSWTLIEQVGWNDVLGALFVWVAGLVAILVLISAPLLYTGRHDAAAVFVATGCAYVMSYEWLHLAYHQPPDSLVGRNRLISWLREHHANHHRPELMKNWNFNVTLPLWDYVRGTWK